MSKYIIFVILIIITVIWVRQKMLKVINPLKNAFSNELKCKGEKCPAVEPIDLPPPNMSEWLPHVYDGEVAVYSCYLTNCMIRSIEKKTNIILPSGVRLLDSFKIEGGESNFCTIFETTSMKGLKTVWVNCRGSMESIDLEYDIETSSINIDDNQIRYGNVYIHSGFFKIYNMLLDRVRDVVLSEVDGGGNVVVAGHSLGGAVATLLGLQLSYYHTTVAVYSTASPRIGNSPWASLCNDHGGIWRIVNTVDLIPTLPLSVTPVKNTLQFYEHGGKLVTFTSNWFSLINNHVIANYFENLYLNHLDTHIKTSSQNGTKKN
mgnify:CR=1 FL=1